MKRSFGIIMALVVLGLVASGCGKKQETSAPAEKPASTGSVNMQEGKWEVTTTFEMQGMPSGMMKPTTVTTCLSQKDYVPKDEGQKDCIMKDVKVNGNTVSWAVACKDSSGTGTVTYAGSTFDGVTEMMMKEGGKETAVKMTMKGRHIGPCQ